MLLYMFIRQNDSNPGDIRGSLDMLKRQTNVTHGQGGGAQRAIPPPPTFFAIKKDHLYS